MSQKIDHHEIQHSWFQRLIQNSRFWILAVLFAFSINIIGFMQLEIPDGSLQTIRIEQTFGFISLALLYTAIIISPAMKVWPNFPGREAIFHARRGIGVSAFYYALLHVGISFFGQLGGFAGIPYLNATYGWSLVAGVFALGVLAIMAGTSLDIAVKWMGYKHWKLLHRLVYLASLTVLFHVLLIGPHFDNGLTVFGAITYLAAIVLIVLEIFRIRSNSLKRKAEHATTL